MENLKTIKQTIKYLTKFNSDSVTVKINGNKFTIKNTIEGKILSNKTGNYDITMSFQIQTVAESLFDKKEDTYKVPKILLGKLPKDRIQPKVRINYA